MAPKDPDPAAVERERQALKNDQAASAKFKQEATAHGWFVAIEQARTRKSMGPALFAHNYRRYFDLLLGDVKEAQKEIDHLRNALRQMELAASQGLQRQTVERVNALPDDAQFQEGLRLFQAWLASLFETYVNVMGFIEGTKGVTDKVKHFEKNAQQQIGAIGKGFKKPAGTSWGLYKELNEL